MHFQNVDVGLTTLTLPKKAQGAMIVRFSPNHELVAIGTVHGKLALINKSIIRIIIWVW